MEKNILFCKIFENYLQKMKLSKIDQWQFGYDHFLANFIGSYLGYALPNETFKKHENFFKTLHTRDAIEGGGNGVCVTEQSGFLKNVSLNKFRKIPYIEWFIEFFVILCIIMQ